jgi:hypothetical protein
VNILKNYYRWPLGGVNKIFHSTHHNLKQHGDKICEPKKEQFSIK